MKEFVIKHRKGLTITAYIMLVFFACFTFPIVNLKLNNYIFSLYNVGISIFAYCQIGLLFRELYKPKDVGKILFASLCFTIVGFVCRYFLEFGEISNIYNFTIYNLIIHIIVAVCLSSIPVLINRKVD